MTIETCGAPMPPPSLPMLPISVRLIGPTNLVKKRAGRCPRARVARQYHEIVMKWLPPTMAWASGRREVASPVGDGGECQHGRELLFPAVAPRMPSGQRPVVVAGVADELSVGA